MKSKMKILLVGIMSVLLTNCAGNYKIKKESGNKVVDSVPKWYMADINESKACEIKMFGKDKDRVCIYGVATAVSPDLQLSIEKAKMMAKSELADIIKGQMNKESKQFIKELGKTETKTVVTEVETAIVNVITDTPVRGYEIFAQDVTMTKNGYYRTWIGMRLPLGKYNKMYNYTVEQAVDAYNLNGESKKAWDNLKKDEKDVNNSL